MGAIRRFWRHVVNGFKLSAWAFADVDDSLSSTPTDPV